MLFAKKKNFTEAHTNLPVELGPESDVLLEKKIAWAKERQAEAEQLALDAARLLSCTDDQLNKLSKQGFFKRCWNAFSGKNASLERANTANLLQMQKMSLRYITMLQEQQLMTAHSLLALRSNLLTLAAKQEETQELIIALAEKTLARFEALEGRVDQMEITQNLQGWLLTLEDRDYDRKFPTPCLRLMRVINDYFGYKKDGWNFKDVLFLKKALRTVRLDPQKELSMDDFIEALVDEISEEGFEAYSELLLAHAPANVENPCQFLLDNVSLQAVTTVNGLYTQFHEKQEVVEELSENLNCTPEEAFKKLLKGSIARMNVDMAHPVVLSDLAAELLMGLSLGLKLASIPLWAESHETIEEIENIPAEEIFAKEQELDETPDVPLFESVTFAVPDGENKIVLAIDWYQSDLKLDLQSNERVTSACCRGKEWFVITDEGRDYLSTNGIYWKLLRDRRVETNYVHGVFSDCSQYKNIFILKENPYIYSTDGKKWEKIFYDNISSSQEHLLPYKDKWLLAVNNSSSFSYKEKGLIWDSTETSTCDSTTLFVGDLNGPWELLATLPKGIKINSRNILIDDDIIFSVVGYDIHYESMKSLPSIDTFQSIFPNKCQWEKISTDKEYRLYNGSFFNIKNNIIYINEDWGRVVIYNYYKKIKKWNFRTISADTRDDNMYGVTNGIFMLLLRDEKILISTNGEEFVEKKGCNKFNIKKIFFGTDSILAFDDEGRAYLGKVRKTKS